MSWDILLQKFPEGTSRPEDVPDDYLPPAVGSRAEVSSAIRKLFRSVDLAGESFVTIERSAYTIEVGLGDDEPCSQLLLQAHVSDSDTAATKAILRLAEHFGMRALDCSTSEFIETTAEAANRAAGEKVRKYKARDTPKPGDDAEKSTPQQEWTLSGLAPGPCDRYVYLSLLPGESPKRLQNGVFRAWSELSKEHGELPGISGPMFVLTLPDGEIFGDFWIRWYPALVTETEEEMIPRVQKGAALFHAFSASTGRRCGEIEDGATFHCDDGQRIPLAQCKYDRLQSDADYARKVKPKKKG